jgi:hypothetical protein
LAVCSANVFTSEATTANPRPASPARCLDGRVERQQIGLAGDGLDEIDDVADPGAGAVGSQLISKSRSRVLPINRVR